LFERIVCAIGHPADKLEVVGRPDFDQNPFNWQPREYLMRIRNYCLLLTGGLFFGALLSASTTHADEPSAAVESQATESKPRELTAQEKEEILRSIRRQQAMQAEMDKLFESKDAEALLDEVAAIFDARQYNKSHYAYSKLIDRFEEKDLAPLLAAYDRAEGVEARIWLAAVADYCGDQQLLKKLADEVERKLKGESRDRAAVAVAFKLGDARMTPYLIEALTSKAKLWADWQVEVGPSAAYLLTALTNHYFGDYPTGLANYSCWVMPPPIVPYPVPMAVDQDAEQAAETQKKWRAWWRDNKARSQKEWALEGLERDVAMVRKKGPIPMSDNGRLESRLLRFLEVQFIDGDPESIREIEQAWKQAQRHYTVPAPLAR
jgi:hypothetical protein